MPQVIYEPCPGHEEATGCYIGLGDADQLGRAYPNGAIFVQARFRFAKLHELGHAFDETMMDAAEREAFTRLRHTRDLLWTWSDTIGDAVVQGVGTPAEDFADAYAACRMQRTPWGVWETGYGYYPTPREHHRICRLLTQAAKDPGSPVAVDGSR